jgi:hypothetical protein
MRYKLYNQMDKFLYTPSRPDGRPADRFVGRSLGRQNGCLLRFGKISQVEKQGGYSIILCLEPLTILRITISTGARLATSSR